MLRFTYMTIESSIRCAKCGYLLRGLELSGACPECGDSIASTMARQSRPPRYRWTIRLFIAFGALHFAIITFLLILLYRGDAEAGIAAFVLDLPIWILWDWVIGPGVGARGIGLFAALLYGALAGWIMYGLTGALLGILIDWMRNLRNPPTM